MSLKSNDKSFWNMVIKPGTKHTFTVERSFHISKAVIDYTSRPHESCGVYIHSAMTSLLVDHGDQQGIILCNLHIQDNKKVLKPEADLDLYFGAGQTIALYSAKIHPDEDDIVLHTTPTLFMSVTSRMNYCFPCWLPVNYPHAIQLPRIGDSRKHFDSKSGTRVRIIQRKMQACPSDRSFWGMVIQPGIKHSFIVERPLHISKAVIDFRSIPIRSSDFSAVTSLLVDMGDNKEIILCNLYMTHPDGYMKKKLQNLEAGSGSRLAF